MTNKTTVQTSSAWLLALGVILIILGILGLGMPIALKLAAGRILGWLLLIGGITTLVNSYASGSFGRRILLVLSGMVFLIAGILTITNPLVGALKLTLVLAVFFFVEGILKVAYSIRIRPAQRWGWMLASGIVALGMAIFIWRNFPGSVATAGLLVAFYLLFNGISMVMLSTAGRGVSNTT